jgi:TPR repeat protein
LAAHYYKLAADQGDVEAQRAHDRLLDLESVIQKFDGAIGTQGRRGYGRRGYGRIEG